MSEAPASNRLPAIIGGSGAASMLAAILWVQAESMQAKTEKAALMAETAVKVSAQHGEEFNEMRARLREIINTLAELKAQMRLGGRFTRDDGDTLRSQIDSLRRDVISLQSQVARISAVSEARSARARPDPLLP